MQRVGVLFDDLCFGRLAGTAARTRSLVAVSRYKERCFSVDAGCVKYKLQPGRSAEVAAPRPEFSRESVKRTVRSSESPKADCLGRTPEVPRRFSVSGIVPLPLWARSFGPLTTWVGHPGKTWTTCKTFEESRLTNHTFAPESPGRTLTLSLKPSVIPRDSVPPDPTRNIVSSGFPASAQFERSLFSVLA